MKHLSWQYLSISGIYQLLLTRFSWNFKGSFLGASRTDSNYQVDIFPCNICPGDICPDQEYLSCYWPYFHDTLNVVSWKHLEQILTIKLTFAQATFVLATFVHIRNISDFDQTLKVSSCEHLLQMPTLMMTFFQATYVLATFLNIRNMLLTKFWPSRQGQGKVRSRQSQS